MHTLIRGLAAGSLLLFGFASGCDSDDAGGGAGGEIPIERDERIPFTPQSDLQFIDGMIPHHAMAVQMADQVLARGSDPAVRALAQRMRDAQLREIDQLKAVRRELTGSDMAPELVDRVAAQRMEELMALSGAALDERFLREMRSHHGGAIQLADRGLRNLERTDMRALAEQIMTDQAKEIGEIQGLLDLR